MFFTKCLHIVIFTLICLVCVLPLDSNYVKKCFSNVYVVDIFKGNTVLYVRVRQNCIYNRLKSYSETYTCVKSSTVETLKLFNVWLCTFVVYTISIIAVDFIYATTSTPGWIEYTTLIAPVPVMCSSSVVTRSRKPETWTQVFPIIKSHWYFTIMKKIKNTPIRKAENDSAKYVMSLFYVMHSVVKRKIGNC